jgi:hypothetical protein
VHRFGKLPTFNVYISEYEQVVDLLRLCKFQIRPSDGF